MVWLSQSVTSQSHFIYGSELGSIFLFCDITEAKNRFWTLEHSFRNWPIKSQNVINFYYNKMLTNWRIYLKNQINNEVGFLNFKPKNI